MKCLIIAAGSGSRLSGKGEMKPLVPLKGMPIIQHVIERAVKGGITEFVVITGFNSEKLESFLSTIGSQFQIPITTAYNADWKQGNGISVLQGKPHLQEPFILVMSDHIFDPATLSGLISSEMKPNEVILAVDRYIMENPYVDLDDVTRVRDENEYIREIGKHIIDFNCFDTGMFKCSPNLFLAIEEILESTGNESLSGGMTILTERNLARTYDILGRFWIDIDNDEMFSKAEQYLEHEEAQEMP